MVVLGLKNLFLLICKACSGPSTVDIPMFVFFEHVLWAHSALIIHLPPSSFHSVCHKDERSLQDRLESLWIGALKNLYVFLVDIVFILVCLAGFC